MNMEDLYRTEVCMERVKEKFSKECYRCFKILEDFERFLKLNGYSLGRIKKYWTFLRRVHSMLCTCFDEATKVDMENFVIKVDSNENWSEWTKYDFKRIVKFFYKWLKGSGKEYPEEVKWIKVKLKRNNEKTPDQILTKEEVELIASKARNLMERAFILCLYESACRIGEFLNIKIKDIQFDQHGCYILVSGKTGWRRVRIMDYSKDLLKWLDSHPSKQDPESYVWVRPDNNQRVTPGFANYLLKELAKKAGITKRVHAHAFRHARATHLAKILTEQQLKVYCGWVNDSRMASVYVHLSGKDVDEALLKAKGIEVSKEEKPKQVVKVCPKCNEPNSYLAHFCKRCGSPLDVKASFEMEKIEELLIEYLKALGEIFPQAKEKFIEIARKKNMLDFFLQNKKKENKD
jgi:integrase/ribosomal protein L40E